MNKRQVMDEPRIKVGIVSEKKLSFALYGDFFTDSVTDDISGKYDATIVDGKIVLKSEEKSYTFNKEVVLYPTNFDNQHFVVWNVIIGVDFHWQRKEKQSFKGTLKLVINGDLITLINIIPVEEYLKSVISSEMSAKSSVELLKAHAVISRSWLLAQIDKSVAIGSDGQQSEFRTETELIKWFDREDHTLFDVCADDHCQRYQGISKILTDEALQAVEETRGYVLKDNDKLCDARFSKSCGGISESFENVWEPKHYDYLVPVVDYRYEIDEYEKDLTVETNAVEWIKGNPPAFCNTTDKKILNQVLLNYDQETSDFYRWTVEYEQNRLSALIYRRSGIDFGEIIDLIPIERGDSGRLIKLQIVGTKKTMTIGKELIIRKFLSESHLYSSAFVVEKEQVRNGIPGKFILRGAGWGHGVGLCQIGAAVMAESGYTFDSILLHYYKDAKLEQLYK